MHVIVTMPSIAIHNLHSELMHMKERSVNCKFFANVAIIIIIVISCSHLILIIFL